MRSRLQHLWATAVETVDFIKKMSLKTGYGSPDRERFFQLVSGCIALEEELPPVPGVPTNRTELKKEIIELHEELSVQNLLTFAPLVLEGLTEDKDEENVVIYLLSLSKNQDQATSMPYKMDHIDEAIEEYSRQETEYGKDFNTVLVWTDSLKQLKELYPNYRRDITDFYQLVKKVIS